MAVKVKYPDQRIRAWLLLGVNDVAKAKQALSPMLTQGGTNYVMVRVDVVQSRFCNLVIPVDVAEEYWTDFVQKLRNKLNRAKVKFEIQDVARVLDEIPDLHLMAHSYVTAAELKVLKKKAPREKYSHGRNPQSPGANPWG